ncbi:hypothetical protein Tco_0248725, partial [Tanacetum coccineum]
MWFRWAYLEALARNHHEDPLEDEQTLEARFPHQIKTAGGSSNQKAPLCFLPKMVDRSLPLAWKSTLTDQPQEFVHLLTFSHDDGPKPL